jgi:hypothetical protein
VKIEQPETLVMSESIVDESNGFAIHTKQGRLVWRKSSALCRPHFLKGNISIARLKFDTLL